MCNLDYRRFYRLTRVRLRSVFPECSGVLGPGPRSGSLRLHPPLPPASAPVLPAAGLHQRRTHLAGWARVLGTNKRRRRRLTRWFPVFRPRQRLLLSPRLRLPGRPGVGEADHPGRERPRALPHRADTCGENAVAGAFAAVLTQQTSSLSVSSFHIKSTTSAYHWHVSSAGSLCFNCTLICVLLMCN